MGAGLPLGSGLLFAAGLALAAGFAALLPLAAGFAAALGAGLFGSGFFGSAFFGSGFFGSALATGFGAAAGLCIALLIQLVRLVDFGRLPPWVWIGGTSVLLVIVGFAAERGVKKAALDRFTAGWR